MKKLLAALLTMFAAACSGGEEAEAPIASDSPSDAEAVSETDARIASQADLERMRAQFAVVEMDVDASFLTDEEVAIVNKLNEVGNYMSEIYRRQRSESNPDWRAEIAAKEIENKDLVLQLFDLHFGPWDTLDHNKPFYGATPMPEGAGFYPADMTKEEFEDWIAEHPEDEDAFRSGYTVIRRDDDGLIAIPYAEPLPRMAGSRRSAYA